MTGDAARGVDVAEGRRLLAAAKSPDRVAGDGFALRMWLTEHADALLAAAEAVEKVRADVLNLHQRCNNGHCSCGALRWPCSTAGVVLP